MPTCPGVKKNKTRGAQVAIDGVQVHTRDGGGRTWAKIHPQHTLTITTKIIIHKILLLIHVMLCISGRRFVKMEMWTQVLEKECWMRM